MTSRFNFHDLGVAGAMMAEQEIDRLAQRVADLEQLVKDYDGHLRALKNNGHHSPGCSAMAYFHWPTKPCDCKWGLAYKVAQAFLAQQDKERQS